MEMYEMLCCLLYAVNVHEILCGDKDRSIDKQLLKFILFIYQEKDIS